MAPTTRYERTQLDRPGEMLVGHPMFERASAVYPPVRTSLEGRSVEGAVRFGASWEGPVGAVHGGFLAAAFDLVLSELAVATLGRCVTRSLRLRYLRPVPVGELVRLDATAGERDGRLLEVTGTASVGGRATTRAVAQFAAVSSRA